MKKSKAKFLKQCLFGGYVLLLASCSSMYIPSNTNFPILTEKNEGQVDVCVSPTGLHLNSSYAISENVGVMINGSYSFRNFTNIYDLYELNEFTNASAHAYAHKYAEIGFGKLNFLKSKFIIESFAGVGYGDAEHITETQTPLFYNSEYFMGFLQFNLGFKNKFVHFGGGVRIGYSMFDLRYPDNSGQETIYNNIDFNNLHIEPGLSARFGKGKLKLVYKVGFSNVFTFNLPEDMNINHSISYGALDYTWMFNMLGLHYTF